jgi:hypothetical protein
MTQTDIDNGKLFVVISIASVKPAEFVIIRIDPRSPRQRKSWGKRQPFKARARQSIPLG